MSLTGPLDPEARRLDEDARRVANWRRWGPYLPERQWATVREDYSPDSNCWDDFPHDQDCPGRTPARRLHRQEADFRRGREDSHTQ
jgi:hypothetical protein